MSRNSDIKRILDSREAAEHQRISRKLKQESRKEKVTLDNGWVRSSCWPSNRRI